MKIYDIKTSEKSLKDMESIYDYIVEKLFAPTVAMNQYNRIADAILSLETMPERTQLMDSEPEKALGIRQMSVDNYSVFFIVKGDIVNIIRVLYSASDISKRLSE